MENIETGIAIPSIVFSDRDLEIISWAVSGRLRTKAIPEEVATFITRAIAFDLKNAYNRYGNYRETERMILARLTAQAEIENGNNQLTICAVNPVDGATQSKE